MEIKSSLLNDKDFIFVKDSLIKVSEKDGKEKFRVKMLEYINDISDNDDDEFFFDMIEFIRFLDPSDDATAFTTPEHLIFMNAPSGGGNPIGENVRKWDFIYDHECLHQLWDTFGVAEKLKKEGIKYNHYVLNVASDCVINDYLSFIRKKELPDNLITPEYLKQEYGIEYDRKRDTQYTLYLKLIEVADKLEKDKRCQEQCGDDSQQQSGNQSQQGGSQSQSGSGSNSSKENKTAEDAQKSADEAKDAAKEAQDAADKAKNNGDSDADGKQKAADEAKDAAKEAQDAANKAKEAKDKGDKEGEEKAAKEAQDAANKAKQAANKATGKKDGESSNKSNNNGSNKEKGEKSSDNQDKDREKGNPGGKDGGGSGSKGNQESEINLDELKKRAEQTIEKYRNKISGDLGSFLKQCQSSSMLKENGLTVQTEKGISLWNQQLNSYVKAYVKKKVFQKHREFKRTYQRTKRGAGFVEFGQPIQRGKKLKEDKLIISVAFYVDRSGSMTGTIDKVFDAAYVIAEALKKQFAKEKVVGDIAFKMYTFDDSIEEIKWGKKVQARGGNMSMHQYLKHIEELTGDYLINIFITDGEFSVDANDVTDLLKKLAGCLIYVTNTPSECSTVMKKLSKTNATQLFYIDADKDFNIK